MARLFHVSDLHFGREDRAAIAWFERLVREERPDAVIVTGDLTMRARSAEYRAATEWLGGLGVPISIEPGNHDLPYFNPIARIFTPYGRFKRVERSIERPLELPGVSIVPLRTTARAQWRLNWSWGVVKEKRLQEAVQAVRATPDGHLTLVACHHPLVPVEPGHGHGLTLRGVNAIIRLAEAGAHAVLSGHVHEPFDVVHDAGRPVRLIGAGTLSERVRESRPSFNELRVDGGQLHVQVRSMA
jgi:3',5'-cyclic AMP phosphodiesterase CpdA